jgi:hypothetical protein
VIGGRGRAGSVELECQARAGVCRNRAIPADAFLACWLPAGHDGPHYDQVDDITWRDGKP